MFELPKCVTHFSRFSQRDVTIIFLKFQRSKTQKSENWRRDIKKYLSSTHCYLNSDQGIRRLSSPSQIFKQKGIFEKIGLLSRVQFSSLQTFLKITESIKVQTVSQEVPHLVKKIMTSTLSVPALSWKNNTKVLI